jgi:hypothetical protein
MQKAYAKIAWAVGAIIRDRLGRSRPESMPKRITELVDALSERDDQSLREYRKEENSQERR